MQKAWTLNPSQGLDGSFPNLGYHFGGPYNEDYSLLGSILGCARLGKLPDGCCLHMSCIAQEHS